MHYWFIDRIIFFAYIFCSLEKYLKFSTSFWLTGYINTLILEKNHSFVIISNVRNLFHESLIWKSYKKTFRYQKIKTYSRHQIVLH
jgi:hypothetical protein